MSNRKKIVISLTVCIAVICCMYIVAILILRCPDTERVDNLLKGNISIEIEQYSIIHGENTITINDNSSVKYLATQLAKSINMGYTRTRVTKQSHAIILRLCFQGAHCHDLPASIVERDGVIGFVVEYNVMCNHDNYYYWVPLSSPIDQRLREVIDRVQLTNT